MTGGQGSFFDGLNDNQPSGNNLLVASTTSLIEKHHLTVLKADLAELEEHERYLQAMLKEGKCLWLED
jgi:hypothetical protein